MLFRSPTAITQLFRLNAGATTSKPALLATSALSDPPDLAEIHALLLVYAARIDELSSGTSASDKYKHLGKPVVRQSSVGGAARLS